MKRYVFTICSSFLIFAGLANAQSSQIIITRPSLTVLRHHGLFPIRAKRTREQKQRLLPDPHDLERYTQFLEQPGTGIFRLMPDLGCNESLHVLRADEICLNTIPESSYYSFREREYTIENLADIRLKKGYLISDGVLSQGILVNLGDVALEDVTPESVPVRHLMNFPLQPLSTDAKKQYTQIAGGVRIGGYEYRNWLPAGENRTYGLRVIAYKGSIWRSFRGFRYDLLAGDKRIDLTVAFRLIRKEPDGTVTLVWKELARRKTPRMSFPKRKNR